MRYRLTAGAPVAAYLGLIVGTNVAFALNGGPALHVFALAGLTMVVRDFVQDQHGRGGSLLLVVLGALISSALAAPAVAVASLVAFVLAELADLFVYGPTKARLGRAAGVALSGVVGSVVDSAVFLTIAFGSLAFFVPQVVGKVGATLAAAAVVAVVGFVRSRRA